MRINEHGCRRPSSVGFTTSSPGGRRFSKRAPAESNTEGATLKIALVHDWLTGMQEAKSASKSSAAVFPMPNSSRCCMRRARPRPQSSGCASAPASCNACPRSSDIIATVCRCCRTIRSLRIPAGVDLVLSFSHAVAKSIQAPPGVPACICFTPMRYAWHMRSEYFQRPAATAAMSNTHLGRSTSVLSQAVRRPDSAPAICCSIDCNAGIERRAIA